MNLLFYAATLAFVAIMPSLVRVSTFSFVEPHLFSDEFYKEPPLEIAEGRSIQIDQNTSIVASTMLLVMLTHAQTPIQDALCIMPIAVVVCSNILLVNEDVTKIFDLVMLAYAAVFIWIMYAFYRRSIRDTKHFEKAILRAHTYTSLNARLRDT